MRRLLLGLALAAPVILTPAMNADDRDHDHDHVYRDRDHNDEHHWDKREDRAYRMYLKENHRRYRDFERLREEDRAAYWAWRHEHSDAILKIDIR